MKRGILNWLGFGGEGKSEEESLNVVELIHALPLAPKSTKKLLFVNKSFSRLEDLRRSLPSGHPLSFAPVK